MSAMIFKPKGVNLSKDLYSRYKKYYGKVYSFCRSDEYNWEWDKKEAPEIPDEIWNDKNNDAILSFAHNWTEWTEPFVKEWDKSWIYAFNEGVGSVVSASWKDTKDILNVLSYDGALNFLNFANQRDNKSLVFVASGKLHLPKIELWRQEEGNYYEGYYTAPISNHTSHISTPRVVPVTKQLEDGELMFEGLILKEAGSGMRKYFNTETKVFVENLDPSVKSVYCDRIRPVDFIFKLGDIINPSLQDIRRIKSEVSFNKKISVLRWSNLERVKPPIQLDLSL